MRRGEVASTNYRALILEGFFFFNAFAFIDPNSLLPILIDTYTHSLTLAGLAPTIYTTLTVLSQLVFGPRMPQVRNIPAFLTRLMLIMRPASLLAVPVLLSPASPGVKVGAVLMTSAVIAVAQGMIGPLWMDLFGRTIPGEQRGRLLGNQQIVAGIGSLGVGLAIKYILETPALSHDVRFSILLGLGSLLMLGTAYAFAGTRDLPRAEPGKAASLAEYCCRMPGHLSRNREYRKVLTLQFLNGFVAMLYPFVILYAKHSMDLSASQVSLLLYLQLVGRLIGGVAWGRISWYLGNKYIIVGLEASALLMMGLAVAGASTAAPGVGFGLIVAAVILSGMNMIGWIGFINYTIDVVEESSRTVYIVMSNMLTLPLALLPYLTGFFAQRAGFAPLFLVSALAAMTVLVGSRRLRSPAEMKRMREGLGEAREIPGKGMGMEA